MPSNSKEYARNYYLKNKAKRSKKINCDVCGSMIASEYMKDHQRREICRKYLKTIPLVVGG